MARRPVSMNKQSEIHRLKGLGFKERAIARTLKMSRKTVHKYLTETSSSTLPESQILFSWEDVNRDYQVNDVPLQILWEEFKEEGKVDRKD